MPRPPARQQCVPCAPPYTPSIVVATLCCQLIRPECRGQLPWGLRGLGVDTSPGIEPGHRHQSPPKIVPRTFQRLSKPGLCKHTTCAFVTSGGWGEREWGRPPIRLSHLLGLTGCRELMFLFTPLTVTVMSHSQPTGYGFTCPGANGAQQMEHSRLRASGHPAFAHQAHARIVPICPSNTLRSGLPPPVPS